MRTDDDWLDRLLAEARAQRIEPSQALMARVLLDADAARGIRPAPPVSRGDALRAWFEALGGWLGFGGLAAAATAGFWLGYVPPDILSSFLPVLGTDVELTGFGLGDPFADLEQ